MSRWGMGLEGAKLQACDADSWSRPKTFQGGLYPPGPSRQTSPFAMVSVSRTSRCP